MRLIVVVALLLIVSFTASAQTETPTPTLTPTETATPTPTHTPTPEPWVYATLEPETTDEPNGQMTRFDYVVSAADVHIANLLTFQLLSEWAFFLFFVLVGSVYLWRRGK